MVENLLQEKALHVEDEVEDSQLHMDFKRRIKLDSDDKRFDREITNMLAGDIVPRPMTPLSPIQEEGSFVRDIELEKDPYAHRPPSKKKMKKTMKKEKAR